LFLTLALGIGGSLFSFDPLPESSRCAAREEYTVADHPR
jgi:hypothetical protein